METTTRSEPATRADAAGLPERNGNNNTSAAATLAASSNGDDDFMTQQQSASAAAAAAAAAASPSAPAVLIADDEEDDASPRRGEQDPSTVIAVVLQTYYPDGVTAVNVIGNDNNNNNDDDDDDDDDDDANDENDDDNNNNGNSTSNGNSISSASSNAVLSERQTDSTGGRSRAQLSVLRRRRRSIAWARAFVVVALAVVVAVTAAVIRGGGGGESTDIREVAPTAAPFVTTPSTDVTASTVAVTNKLKASDGAAENKFGWSVAISGDAIAIGTIGDDDRGSKSGSVYVYTRSENVWTEQAKLTANDGAANDRYGYSVAIDGDTIVIGAPDAEITDNNSDSGRTYVYTYSGTVWAELTKLVASDGTADDRFGGSLAIAGDTIVIGAPSNSGTNSSAYVYTTFGNLWTEQAKLTASDDAEGNWFGHSVATDGNTTVVGAQGGTKETGLRSGSAYVYTRSGTVWTEQAKLTASDGALHDQFGFSVAIYGDAIIVGANRASTEYAKGSGSAYVFTHSGTVWTEQVKLTASDGAWKDQFGFSVAIHGDAIIIGADEDDTANGSNSGSVYLYTRLSGTFWTEQVKLIASDGLMGDRFGSSVAIDGGIIVIGADSSNPMAEDDRNGSAYVLAHSGIDLIKSEVYVHLIYFAAYMVFL